MAVVINEFELVPEERRAAPQSPAPQQQPQAMSPQALARQIEASLRTLAARRERLRAT